MSNVDFLVIGVQKGGTTSLFEYMRRHPQVHMPAEKDINFFNNDRKFHRGADWYLPTVTRGAPSDAVCGEASTYYMSGTPFGDLFSNEREAPDTGPYEGKPLELVVPERIKMMLPDARLICVLRDPIARAHSHHRMMGLERAESRPFDDAITELLDERELEQARVAPTRTNNYIVNGEYGRVLEGFLEVFPREQLLAIFSDELAENPEETLERVFAFIGVNPSFVPENVGTKYRTGAEKERIAGLNLYTWQASLAGLRPAKALWHRLPDRVRGGVDRAFTVTSYRVAMWNARRGVTGEQMSPSVREGLRAHFTPDGNLLSELLGREVPWLATWGAASSAGSRGTAVDAHRS